MCPELAHNLTIFIVRLLSPWVRINSSWALLNGTPRHSHKERCTVCGNRLSLGQDSLLTTKGHEGNDLFQDILTLRREELIVSWVLWIGCPLRSTPCISSWSRRFTTSSTILVHIKRTARITEPFIILLRNRSPCNVCRRVQPMSSLELRSPKWRSLAFSWWHLNAIFSSSASSCGGLIEKVEITKPFVRNSFLIKIEWTVKPRYDENVAVSEIIGLL